VPVDPVSPPSTPFSHAPKLRRRLVCTLLANASPVNLVAHPAGVSLTVSLTESPTECCTQVLEEKETSVGGALMGSSHTYVIPGAAASSRAVDKLPAAVAGAAKAVAKADVSVTLRPEELEGLDDDAIKGERTLTLTLTQGGGQGGRERHAAPGGAGRAGRRRHQR
jgi:hypothetical protein